MCKKKRNRFCRFLNLKGVILRKILSKNEDVFPHWTNRSFLKTAVFFLLTALDKVLYKSTWTRHLETTLAQKALTHWAHRLTKSKVKVGCLCLHSASVCLISFSWRCSGESLSLIFPLESPWIPGLEWQEQTTLQEREIIPYSPFWIRNKKKHIDPSTQ